MKRRFDTVADLPGQRPVTWRRSAAAIPLAVVVGAAWPPLILTLPLWPATNWMPALDMDWRLIVLVLGLVAVSVGVWALTKERERTGRPETRLGVVWRFMFYGGLLAGALEGVLALLTAMLGWFSPGGGVGQAIGFTETALLIFGVLGLPVAIVVGVSYALWAGLCVALIAFMPRPASVRDRLGLMRDEDDEPL